MKTDEALFNHPPRNLSNLQNLQEVHNADVDRNLMTLIQDVIGQKIIDKLRKKHNFFEDDWNNF